MLLYKTFPVGFNRTDEIKISRKELPSASFEYDIVDSVVANEVTIVIGSTGSGKTTQVPQYLMEAGFGRAESLNPGKIVLTQPRRIATISTAERIRSEVGDASLVSYKTRFDSSVYQSSVLDVMTEGVLLKHVIDSPLLEEFSVIILDEVHERSYNCDFLVSLLCRIVRTRNATGSPRTLRLLLMSATIQSALIDFVRSFCNLNIVEIEGITYPVHIHYSKRAVGNIVEAAAKKVKRIMERLPEGRILVFLPAKRDIYNCSELLKIPGLNVYHLHGSMRHFDQALFSKRDTKGFDVILSTNIAETSITIPDVSYIIDSGLVKRRVYDQHDNSSSFSIGWTSQSSAQQRAGRTGRTIAGHCYRLYTSNTFYNDFKKFESPEIESINLDLHILLCLRLGIHDIEEFSMPSNPNSNQVTSAYKRLASYGILNESLGLKDEFFHLTDIPLPVDCSILIVQSLLSNADCNVISLCVLMSIVMSCEDVLSDNEDTRKLYKDFFRGDIIFECHLILCLVKNAFSIEFYNHRVFEEVINVYKQLKRIIEELVNTKIKDLNKVDMSKSTINICNQIMLKSLNPFSAIRGEKPNRRGEYPYYCSYDQEVAYISPKSLLHSRNPAKVLYRYRIRSPKGHLLLTRLNEIP